MNKKAIILVLSVFICTTFIRSQTNNLLTNEQKTWLSKANRHEKTGWTYLHIEGTPQEGGFQHGYLLAKEIREAIRDLSVAWNYQRATLWGYSRGYGRRHKLMP